MGTPRILHHENTATSRSWRIFCVTPCIPPIEQPPNGSIPALYRQMSNPGASRSSQVSFRSSKGWLWCLISPPHHPFPGSLVVGAIFFH